MKLIIHKNTGKKRTEEFKKKRSEKYKGKNNPFYGKKHSKKTIEKIKQAKKGKNGHKHTVKTKEKISEAHKGKKKNYYSSSRFKKGDCKGEKNPNWKGGITTENNKIRSSIEFSLWREAVFARDNWTCQKTGVRGGSLVTHHIYNFADYPKLRLAIDNGITLSEKEHKKFHKIYGRKNNTKKQLKEFLNKL